MNIKPRSWNVRPSLCLLGCSSFMAETTAFSASLGGTDAAFVVGVRGNIPNNWNAPDGETPDGAMAPIARAALTLAVGNGGQDFPIYITEFGYPSHSVWWYNIKVVDQDPTKKGHNLGPCTYRHALEPGAAAMPHLDKALARDGRPSTQQEGGWAIANRKEPTGMSLRIEWKPDHDWSVAGQHRSAAALLSGQACAPADSAAGPRTDTAS